MERKELGVRRLLRHLRGTSPRPPTPEGQIQNLLEETGEPSGIGTGAHGGPEPGGLVAKPQGLAGKLRAPKGA